MGLMLSVLAYVAQAFHLTHLIDNRLIVKENSEMFDRDDSVASFALSDNT